MRQKLQEAIGATRAGRTRDAQLILTDILKEDPTETQAWFLLSNLVESSDKKIAYLGKVLALDPNHNKAAQQLAYLQTQTAVAGKTPPPTITPRTTEPEEEPIDWLADGDVDTADVPDDPDEAMAWLESLAADQMEEPAPTQPAIQKESGDSDEAMTWLNNLAEEFTPTEPAIRPAEDETAMDWLADTMTEDSSTTKEIAEKQPTEVATTPSNKQAQIEQYDRYIQYLTYFIILLVVLLLISFASNLF